MLILIPRTPCIQYLQLSELPEKSRNDAGEQLEQTTNFWRDGVAEVIVLEVKASESSSFQCGRTEPSNRLDCRLSSVTLVSVTASKAWPLTEVEGCIPGAKDGHAINHNFSFRGKQGQPIHFISS
ncbi:LRR receptor-like serine/threonine-protein kinase [Pyrus ussuriensis x Pyrus communis]|uniref:LRR receptor-like serine/threonine-protein kinase n=1 Tax=Pyrus ussuriensis x Pyrus communis TaxID=2448454 RepID=A0A5N5EU69_9ROSA|nr:LRR receptor-like serine/threonine-protein kinase [Pyrus ussuriensis x Pyrus communis]